MLQELQCTYSFPRVYMSSDWQRRRLQQLLPLKLMPCLRCRLHLGEQRPLSTPEPSGECLAWQEFLQGVLLGQLGAF